MNVPVPTQDEVDKIRQICSEYLGGSWEELSKDDFECELMKGGWCNLIYKCTNKRATGFLYNQESVVYRKYGSPWVGRRGDLISVCDAAIPVIAQTLFYEKLGPKVFAILNDARIEEYISHTKVPLEERENDQVLAIVMRKIAKIHRIQMPISKNPNWIFDLIERWFDSGKDNKFLNSRCEGEMELYRQKVLDFPWKEELKWLRDRISNIESPIVFTHNDVSYDNIMFRDGFDNLEEKILVIDYENCSYGYRGYDLAFFLLSKSIDYSTIVDIETQKTFWPDRDRRQQLIEFYREEYLANHCNEDPRINSIDHLLMEVDFFHILHLLLFACYTHKKLTEEFLKLLKYTYLSIDEIQELKEQLIKDYPLLENSRNQHRLNN